MLDIQEPNSSLLYSVMKPQAFPMISGRGIMQKQWYTHIQEGFFSQLRMVTTTDSGFSWGKDCLLPKDYLFQPRIASSPTSLQKIFFLRCSKLLLREHRLGTECLRGNKGNPVSLEIFLPCKKLVGLKYPMKLPWNLKHLSQELIFLYPRHFEMKRLK